MFHVTVNLTTILHFRSVVLRKHVFLHSTYPTSSSLSCHTGSLYRAQRDDPSFEVTDWYGSQTKLTNASHISMT